MAQGLPRGHSVAYGLLVATNIAWPRKEVYDALSLSPGAHGHWYWQWIAPLFIGIVVIIGSIYYFAVYRRTPIAVLKEKVGALCDELNVDYQLSAMG